MIFDAIKEVTDNYKVESENGATMFETSGDPLLNMNFRVSSYRNMSEEEILSDFDKAYAANPELALKWVFYVGDIREGLGERRLFRTLIKYVVPRFKNLIEFIAEYNRFDSLFELFGTAAEGDMLNYIKSQLKADCDAMAAGKKSSLLAKWMPSINTSSEKARGMAKRFRKFLHLTEKEYRKTLSALRSHIEIVEQKMCDGKWGDIDYSTVPSKANLLYKDAFMNHDAERRQDFLEKMAQGEAKINASAAFPHDITRKYRYHHMEVDDSLEALWKALPNSINDSPMIVVRDGSGSMCINMDNSSNTTALDVATSLAIYCSERTSDAFKDKFITFSRSPRLVDMSNLTTLRDKLALAENEDECDNTNVEAVFDLLLNVATEHKLKQREIPTILIISDMEFDRCAVTNDGYLDQALFESIGKKWAKKGYKLPTLVFWNVCSRTKGIPLKENELGVKLISGFSPNIMNMVLSDEKNAYKSMVDVLNGERYKQIHG